MKVQTASMESFLPEADPKATPQILCVELLYRLGAT